MKALSRSLPLPALLALLLGADLPAQPQPIDDIQPALLIEEPKKPENVEVPTTPAPAPAPAPVPLEETPLIPDLAPPEVPAAPPAAPEPSVSSDAALPAADAGEVKPPTPPGAALTVEEVIEEIIVAEKKEAPPSPEPKVTPPSFGDTTGQAYIGHRAIVDRYAGWGWIKPEGGTWNRSQWAVIEEVPREMPVPGRFLEHPNNDDNTQYKLYGEWAEYTAYEPNYDIFVPVFKLRGFEVIGPAAKPAGVRPPRGTNMKHSERAYGGGGARNNPFDR